MTHNAEMHVRRYTQYRGTHTMRDTHNIGDTHNMRYTHKIGDTHNMTDTQYETHTI